MPGKTRERLISFRVSATEYDLLRQACEVAGARNISDFTRAAALFQVQVLNSPRGLLTEHLVVLTMELTELDKALQEMSARIQGILRAPKDT